MAQLIHMTTGRRVLLRNNHLIGRSRRTDLRLDDAEVSSEHASIRWTADGWQLLDLGSRNGTYHQERRIDAGERVVLKVGALLAFGGRDKVWRFDSDDPPGAVAESLVDGSLLAAEDQMLSLPDEQTPIAFIYRDVRRGWMLEQDGQSSSVRDGVELEVAGVRWRLHLPEAIIMTDAAQTAPLDVYDMRLRFSVSSDEEHVALCAFLGDRELDLKAYAHHYTLLNLARLRLRDAEDATQPETAHGWVHIDDLAQMLRVEESMLNIHIHRARKQLARSGVANAANLIERRSYQRQLRLGVAHIEICTI